MTPLLRSGQSDVANSPIKTPGKIEGKMGFLSRKKAPLLIKGEL